MNRKRGFWIALWAILVVVMGVFAFGYGGYGPWHGWGRMGAWDGGYRAGSQGWYDMGYGMMGPYGAGMPWADAGMGFGMAHPALTQEQVQKISRLQQEALVRNRGLTQQLWAAHDALSRLHMNEQRDWDAIRAASQKLFDLQRQQLDAAIELQQEIDGVLTDSQKRGRARSWRGE